MVTCLGEVALLVTTNSPLTDWVPLENAYFSEVFQEVGFTERLKVIPEAGIFGLFWAI